MALFWPIWAKMCRYWASSALSRAALKPRDQVTARSPVCWLQCIVLRIGAFEGVEDGPISEDSRVFIFAIWRANPAQTSADSASGNRKRTREDPIGFGVGLGRNACFGYCNVRFPAPGLWIVSSYAVKSLRSDLRLGFPSRSAIPIGIDLSRRVQNPGLWPESNSPRG